MLEIVENKLFTEFISQLLQIQIRKFYLALQYLILNLSTALSQRCNPKFLVDINSNQGIIF